MITDWIMRVGDGVNFKNSSRHRIWGINMTTSDGKHFTKNAKIGDRLWFVKNKSNGKIIAVATYWSHNLREVGPLIKTTMSNEELGWTGEHIQKYNTEIHYTDLYNMEHCKILSHIKNQSSITKYNKSTENCKVDLLAEYAYIVKYSKITFEM